MKTDDSILEVCFLIRSYGKGELAMCYIHGVTQQAAVNRFNTWIRKAPGLEQRLLEMGMSRTGRNYTPAQVQAIVKTGTLLRHRPPSFHESLSWDLPQWVVHSPACRLSPQL